MNEVILSDSQFYQLKQNLIDARDMRIAAFRLNCVSVKVVERTRRYGHSIERYIRFRANHREIKKLTLTELQRAGIRYSAGMIHLANQIAKIDEMVSSMAKHAHKAVHNCTCICLNIIELAERQDLQPGKLCTIPTYEFSIEGPYSPLPYLARRIAFKLIHRAFACASQKVLACNRLRKWAKGGKYSYSPRVCPGILIRESHGVTPVTAEWGFFIRRWPSKEYHFRRTIRSRQHRATIEIKSGPNLQQIRSFRLKRHAHVYRGMGEFVAEVMRIRERNRSLWEFVRNRFIAKRDSHLLDGLKST